MLTMSGFDEEKSFVILSNLLRTLYHAPPELKIQAYNIFLEGIKALSDNEKLSLLCHFDSIKDYDSRYLIFWLDLQILLSLGNT